MENSIRTILIERDSKRIIRTTYYYLVNYDDMIKYFKDELELENLNYFNRILHILAYLEDTYGEIFGIEYTRDIWNKDESIDLVYCAMPIESKFSKEELEKIEHFYTLSFKHPSCMDSSRIFENCITSGIVFINRQIRKHLQDMNIKVQKELPKSFSPNKLQFPFRYIQLTEYSHKEYSIIKHYIEEESGHIRFDRENMLYFKY